MNTSMRDDPSVIDEPHCPGCEYNLRGIDSDNCPECGLLIDRELAERTRIPWEHRRQIGIVPAYFKTAALMILSPSRFVPDITLRVRRRDARLFVFLSVMIFTLPAIFPIALVYWRNSSQQISILAIAVGIAVAVWLAIQLPCWFLFPVELRDARQERTRSIAMYAAAAPWALMSLVQWMLTISSIPALTLTPQGSPAQTAWMIAAIASGIAMFILAIISPVRWHFLTSRPHWIISLIFAVLVGLILATDLAAVVALLAICLGFIRG